MRARSVWIFIGSGLTVAALNLYLVSLAACTQAPASPEPAPSTVPSAPVQQPQAPQPIFQWAAPSDDGTPLTGTLVHVATPESPAMLEARCEGAPVLLVVSTPAGPCVVAGEDPRCIPLAALLSTTLQPQR